MNMLPDGAEFGRIIQMAETMEGPTQAAKRSLPIQSAVKRFADITGALCGLIVLSPLLLMVALLVRLKLGSPALFRQQRPGLDGQLFTILKFRTMTDATDDSGDPLPDAQRLMGLGRLLRSLSIDELPELLNVLKGEMSLIGPRPLLVEYLDRYSPEQARRHEIRPGITGWAQVNGRNSITWEQKFEMDVWYVDHWNLWVDAKILVKTVAQVVLRRGISAPGQETMTKFKGTAHGE